VLSYGYDSITLSIEEEVMSTNYINEVLELDPIDIADLTVSGFVTLLDADHVQINIWSWVGNDEGIISAEMKYRQEYPELVLEGVADLNWSGDEDLTPEMQQLWETICGAIDHAVKSGLLFTKGA
jgi:hypothetical protein